MVLTEDITKLLDDVFRFTEESVYMIRWNAKHDKEDIVILFPPCYKMAIGQYFNQKGYFSKNIFENTDGDFHYYGTLVKFLAPNNDFYVFSKTYYERTAEFEGKFHFSYSKKK